MDALCTFPLLCWSWNLFIPFDFISISFYLPLLSPDVHNLCYIFYRISLLFMVLLICFILTCDCIWISTLLLYLSVSFAFVNLFSKDFIRRSWLIFKNWNSRSKRYPFCFNSFLVQVLSSASTFPVPSDLYSLVPYSQHSLRISLSFLGELHARDLCVSGTEMSSNF